MNILMGVVFAGGLVAASFVLASAPLAKEVAPDCRVPPPAAIAAGFTRLDFTLDPRRPLDIGWDDRPGHNWYPGMWWASDWPRREQIEQDRQQGILRLKNTVLTTIVHHDPSPGGRSWNGGYFEVDGVGHNWSSFWLMSLLHAQRRQQRSDEPLTYTAELDIYEGDEGTPNTLVSTLHYDTSGDAGVPDKINGNNNRNVSPIRIAGRRHRIGALWLPERIDIYLDGEKVNSFPTFPSTNQPMFMVIGEGDGGVNHGPTVEPGEYDIHAVCVWQR
jgi:hypothetical protein